nr:MICOS complex subunit MIC60-like [Aegilops tauschii subsp. strangulata]
MAPRKAKAAVPPAWYDPALDAPNVSEKNFAATRLLTAGESNEKGKTELRAGSAKPEAQGSTFYPFFMSSVIAGMADARGEEEEGGSGGAARTNLPAAAASPSMEKGSDGAHASPARSSSRGLGEHPREESAPVAPLAREAPVSGSAAGVPKAQEPPVSQAMVTMLPPPPAAAPLVPDPSASPDVLERALSEMTRLREDLQGADPHLDVEAAQDRYRVLEAELKTLRNERAEEARGRKAEEEKMKAREDAVRGRDTEMEQLGKAQAAERGRLEKLKQEMEAEKAELDAKAKVLAEDREAFQLLEERSHVALRALYEKGLEEPLATNNEGPAQLLLYLVEALEEVVSGIGPMAEGEARVLSSAALTRVFSHLHLRDPAARLDELLELVDDEHCAAAAVAVKGQVEAPLEKFRAFAPMPSTGGAVDPATPAGSAGEGDTTKEEASPAGDGGVQG